ncbi:MAG: dinuclear metal center YbgI/SA1388 family protein [Cyclobacteriaceae bacterium]|jgi:dinuclear metal center YbgI/SA1388 family protein
MKIKDILNTLEEWAPSAYQESYDNSGLLVGDADLELTSALISLDVTEAVLDEAITNGCNLIIAHHPLIYNGIKQITPQHWVNRCIIKAIKHDICLYAIHTNLDNISTGVNAKIADVIGLTHTKILKPKTNKLSRLTTFAPEANAEKVLAALFDAGAGKIGNYDNCSFQSSGTGTFRPSKSSNPHIGEADKLEKVNERRIEVLIPTHRQRGILQALQNSHPYEEIAYYMDALSNENQEIGSGVIGKLEKEMTKDAFLQHLKDTMKLSAIRFTDTNHATIQKVAVCGGSGSFLLQDAVLQGADAFVTADFKYHDFFESDSKIMVADIGHYESEAFTKELLYDFLQEKFTNIALRLTKVNTNPINYL